MIDLNNRSGAVIIVVKIDPSSVGEATTHVAQASNGDGPFKEEYSPVCCGRTGDWSCSLIVGFPRLDGSHHAYLVVALTVGACAKIARGDSFKLICSIRRIINNQNCLVIKIIWS